ncbi:MAG: hypothetical protein KA369_17870 [Spirochaetes bacterium]|nr:hypothetical protein [Spirochaetota bacterium]
MKKIRTADKVVPINRIGDTEKYILVPRLERKRAVKKVKRLIRVKGECYFTQGVPVALIDFIYRAVVKLGLRNRKLIFSRGSVKINGRPTSNVVEVYDLDWDLGTSVIIPMKRAYGDMLDFTVGGSSRRLRLMEIMVLSGMLKLVCADKSEKWRSARAASIMALGWEVLNKANPPDVSPGTPD